MRDRIWTGLLLCMVAPIAAGADSTFAHSVKLPVAFEPNVGQSDASVRFLARGSGVTVFFTDTGAVVLLERRKKTQTDSRAGEVVQTSLRMRMDGARPPRKTEGLERLPGVSNYYLGNDPSQWHAGVPQYARMAYRDVYPGIDLICYGANRNLEYDFVVAPGADPRQVRFSWEGSDGQSLNMDGDLVLRTPLGDLVQKRPRVYQQTAAGRVEVAAKYQLARDGQVTVAMARYDRRRPLIIDPQLVYSTYLGGNGTDIGHAIAVDSSASAYIVGETSSSTFPVQSPVKTQLGSTDAFITKLSPNGASLMYSSFFGGGANDKALAVAVDSFGSAYVTGATLSNDFPPLNPLQGKPGGGVPGGSGGDAFVTKFIPDGELSYSTYLGGSADDVAQGIAVDTTGAAYVAGYTLSTNFPVQSALQSTKKGDFDAFVAKLSPAGSSLIYSTYLGGSAEDQAWAIAVDGSSAAYVTGFTLSADFPTAAPYQATLKSQDIFVTKISSLGPTIVYSTYIGGSSTENGYGIAVDSSGSAYVTGRSLSGDFPVTTGAYQTKTNGGGDAVVFKLSASGNALVYSTYVGGTGNDIAYAIAVDSAGSAYAVGTTESTDFPAVSQYQKDQPNDDAFLFKLSPDGSALVYSTYLGGSGNDYGQGVAVDPFGAAYVTGYTDSNNYPTKAEFLDDQTSTDAFVTKLEPLVLSGGKAQLISPLAGSTFPGSTVTFTWTSVTGATAYGLLVGNAFNVADIFDQELGLATSQTVTGIPIDGRSIWVRLATQINGSVFFNDYFFKAFNNGQAGLMSSPVPGSVLTGANVTFTWLPGSAARSYQLDIGSVIGASDLYRNNVGLATSQAVTGLPVDGSGVFVRLTTNLGTGPISKDYTYTAASLVANPKGVITMPSPGSTFTGSEVVFAWTFSNTSSKYFLTIGDTFGGSNLFSKDEGFASADTVENMPTDGRTIYVRLGTLLPSGWAYSNYTYIASGSNNSKAVMTNPAPGSTLSQSLVFFQWTPGTGATGYWLDLGTKQGSADILSQNAGTSLFVGTSVSLDGSTVYARLWTAFGNTWQFSDYSYTAGAGVSKAAMQLPPPGSKLTGTSVTFSWSPGTGATAYRLEITEVQGFTTLSSTTLTGTSQAVTIPAVASTIYVRLVTVFPTGEAFTDYTYTASGAGAKADLTIPTPGSSLSGSKVTFFWNAGAPGAQYVLYLSSFYPGGYDIGVAPAGTALSVQMTGLPTDGSTIYARLYTGTFSSPLTYNDYTFKAAGGTGAITAPSAQSTLTGSSVTFRWNPVASATGYWLDVGTSLGGSDLFTQGEALQTEQNVTGLPSGGVTIYVRLWTAVNSQWVYNDYTYKAAP
jgi:hypothetical protein